MDSKQAASNRHMKILLVHNFYGSTAPSGENQVFESEHQLLSSRGHEVLEFTRHSDEIRAQGHWGVLKGASATPWNPWMTQAIVRLVKRYQPNVVHVHNTFPLISHGIFHAIGNRAARVLTLHNYRLFCATGIPMRDGQVCSDCLNARSAIPAIKHGCYRNSRAATLPLALSIALHRAAGTWTRHVDAFIALSEFQRLRMAESGLPLGKVHVKPNFFPGAPSALPWQDRGNYVVFAGRLSPEKGVLCLLNAWVSWGKEAPELRLVGDGPLRDELEGLAKGLPVRFLGQLTAAETQSQIANARLLVLPSEWFEGFPMVLREAFAYGTPAAVSSIGPLPSIVRQNLSGVVFEPANSESILEEIRRTWLTPGLLEQLGKGARAEFEDKYTEETNYATLMDIYDRAITASRSSNNKNHEK